MTLIEAMSAMGLQPPHTITPGRWIRFPGMGKSKSNRAGWCRMISPTLAIFGDWSSGITSTWRDNNHRDDAESRRLLREARARERVFAAEQRKRQDQAAFGAVRLIQTATVGTHPYLAKKGFPTHEGLVSDGKLVIPVRDVSDYSKVISAQLIDEHGEKRFLTGGRTKGGIHRFGSKSPRKVVLCEGYATGLTLNAAMAKLPGPHAVIVCFSANNLEHVAKNFPGACVAADHDVSATGENTAIRTGLRWTMPYECGTDFNDLHANLGLHVVVERMRELFSR
jgi:putative DNA primase/helicase